MQPQDVRGWNRDRWLYEAMVQRAILAQGESPDLFTEAVCGGENVAAVVQRFPWKEPHELVHEGLVLCRTRLDGQKLPIPGFTAQTRPFTQPDYPFGRAVRCLRRVWVETSRHGMRFGAQTNDPKRTDSLVWNKPKYGTYHEVMVLVLDLDNGHIEWPALSMSSMTPEIERFEGLYASVLGEDGARRLDLLKRMKERLEGSSHATNR